MPAAARASLHAIEVARSKRAPRETITVIIMTFVSMGVEGPLDDLGMAVLKYPYDENRARWELNPWFDQAALARLGNRRLTPEEQREVYCNTRKSWKVIWPEWLDERE